MTAEPPTPPARPRRPDRSFRQAALADPTAGEGQFGDARENLRDALARIPDLDRAGHGAKVVQAPAAPAPTPDPPVPGPVSETPDQGRSRSGGGLRSVASRLVNGTVPEGAVVVDSTVAAPEPAVGEVDDLLEDDDIFVSDDPQVPASLAREGGHGVDPARDRTVTEEVESVQRLLAMAPVPVLTATAADSVDRADTPARLTAPSGPGSAGTSDTHGADGVGVARWRRAGFAAAVVLLVVSIPVMARAGYRIVTNSTDGKLVSSQKSPDEPGFQELVESTPTQLLMQTDADGVPIGVTFLSLSGASGGGSVIFVPLETAVRRPGYGVDRLSGAYEVLSDRPADGRKQLGVQVAALLNVGIDDQVELDDRGWAQLVGPVAPLTIDNPDPIETDDLVLPSGPVQLTADQVGPYLRAEVGDESALNRLNRQEIVWRAWLDAVSASGEAGAVPGESSTGIGRFAQSLARGPVTYSVLPTSPADDGTGRLVVDDGPFNDLMLAAVPAPDPPAPGARATVKLLNGVAAGPIPDEVLQTVVRGQGSITIVGNGPRFGTETTTITYSDPADRGHAELLAAGLGAGRVRLDLQADDSVDLTVVLGHDVIDDASSTTTVPSIDTPGTSEGPR